LIRPELAFSPVRVYFLEMSKISVLALVGGISKNSLNRKLFHAVQSLAPDHIQLGLFEIAALPFFSQDIENDPPASVRELHGHARESKALLVITPEYNHSIPGVLKNALDWGSRPPGQSVWEKKPVGIMGASAGNIGTFGAQQHLRNVLATLNMMTMNKPEFCLNGSKAFDSDGKLIDEKTREFIVKYWQAFDEWIAKFQ
jgi:NAD(P)H-dependent FMN reductase